MTSQTLTLYRFPFKAMGSPCEVQLYCRNPDQAQSVADKVIEDAARIEAKYSRYRETSVLSRINRAAAFGESIAIDEETLALLNYADACYRQSDGLFDITSGILREAWDFKTQKIPSRATVGKLLKKIGWEKIDIADGTIRFKVPGMQLDFGGIGKEYAVDRAATLCSEHGIEHGLIDMGGDIRIIGPHADGRPWLVGIRHPRIPGALLASLPVYRSAIASSGDYERCIVLNGQHYSHILNPKTGWPVHGLTTVSVLAEHCVIAGSACTIAMLMDKRYKQWLDALGLPHLWMDRKGKIGGNIGERRD